MRKWPFPVGVALPHAHARAAGGWARGGRGFSRGAHVREAAGVAPPRGGGAMELEAARRAVLAAVRGTRAADLPRLLHWMRNTHDFDELVVSNNDVVLRNIAEDLRNRLPIEAMFTSEHQAVQKIHQHPLPMIHVDAFLYDDDDVDSLCEEGKMSRSYCTECGSYKTASLEFISHSFSLMELKFLYQHVLPDLTGKVVVDVGSRLGAVLFAGYLYSSASQLYGVEMNADFCQLQEVMITKYEFIDRIKVVHADICTQPSLLQKADVVVMNNVFEYFLDRQEQARAWEFIACNVRKRGSLLVTVPSLEESLSKLQTDVQLSQWVEEVQLNYDVYMEKDVDREALEQIHLYTIL
uniref:Methyltransferase type 11 domain-containing protein n=1 Tax=Cyanoderma ruficeps TaxID=181631 RepID=A0A8C3QLX0_9PASS